MPRKVPTDTLLAAKEWAHERIRARTEPPWSHFQLMKLIEVVDQILDSAKVVIVRDDSLQSDAHPDTDDP